MKLLLMRRSLKLRRLPTPSQDIARVAQSIGPCIGAPIPTLNVTQILRRTRSVTACKSEVLGLVARDALRLAVIGVGLGLAGAFAVSRLLESQLYGVAPLDPLVFIGAAVLLAAVAMAAALAPALRAARTDPIVALRWE